MKGARRGGRRSLDAHYLGGSPSPGFPERGAPSPSGSALCHEGREAPREILPLQALDRLFELLPAEFPLLPGFGEHLAQHQRLGSRPILDVITQALDHDVEVADLTQRIRETLHFGEHGCELLPGKDITEKLQSGAQPPGTDAHVVDALDVLT